ncbi:5'-nucleotidase, lipoprotein e(P4) family [Sphingomonas sp. PAMC 26617]|uniref:5'-nucleotidase, lipoprotein e(P4) family n=1 Tax=Sphingomonas sp. PAMC 26617 TaxID=1112216 RepID=UPI000287C418|nr:HAD family acid phosphatase [Sphingomonas sp. PAMC 26617]
MADPTLLKKSGFLVLALALSACTTTQAVPLASTPAVPPGMQYLYGSGEAAAQALQTWRQLTGFVAQKVAASPAESVILAEGASLAAPRWVPCGTKPKAVVFDVDETVLLNLGFEANDAAHPAPYDQKVWNAWERSDLDKVAAQPGAVAALAELRRMGVTVIFNTNRSIANADITRATIEAAGLGPAVHGETLYLSGDDAMGSRKDGRRATIAAKFCVVAMGGDQLGDFSDLFNAGLAPAPRRATVLSGPIAAHFGAGWFVWPNPVYGTALKGGLDDIFPQDKRWAPPAGDK